MNTRFLTVFALLLPLYGCKNLAKVNVNIIDERTQLENQVLGTYEDLSEDLTLISSVRGIDEEGNIREVPPESAGRSRALLALQSREFNRDDIHKFKKLGLVGENNQGFLSLFADEVSGDEAGSLEFIKSIVTEENRDREILMRRVIQITPGLNEKDLVQVKKVMASRNIDNARPGEKIQREQGEWVTKKKK